MNKTLVKKVVYLLLMAACLIPMYAISAPSFLRPGGERSEGGTLTQLREEHGLSQANLGEIDPASESMKLATLGMRGVAANLLWERANEYKKKEQWDNYRATLNQIAKLQPNFVTVWQHQAWNLSYNVSVEFDNYEHRYHWVKKGIDFLMEGTRHNKNEPRLLWDLGWFFGHKMGRSDEYKQFRRKYKTDEDFHNSFADKIAVDKAKDFRGQPDNWLTAYQWFGEAQRVVDLEGVPIRGKNPLVFHSDSAKSLIRYADAIEEEGNFEYAKPAWRRAGLRWDQYAQRTIPTSYGYTIQLGNGERQAEKVKQLAAELEAMVPGGAVRLTQEKIARLNPEERQFVTADLGTLPADEYKIAREVQSKIKVRPEDMVQAVEPQKRNAAKVLASRLNEARDYESTIRRYRDIVNFIYWKTRCEVEQQDRAIDGRQFLYEANEAYENIAFEDSISKYDEAWKRWSSIHRDYPVLADDVMAEDLVDAIKDYRLLLGQLGLPFPPKDFPMLRLIANYADEFPDLDAAMLERMADTYDRARDAGTLESLTLSDDVASSAADDNSQNEDESGSTESADDSAGESEAAEADTPASDVDAESDVDDSAKTSTVLGWEDVAALLDSADGQYQEANLAAARDTYESGWKALNGMLPTVSLDSEAKSTVFRHLSAYRALLGQLNEPFPPADFQLKEFVKENAEELGYSEAEIADF